jgi:hypothetical protein
VTPADIIYQRRVQVLDRAGQTRPGRGGAGPSRSPPGHRHQASVDHLAERGVRLSPSGVQKILRCHRLGRRIQRVAALAKLTAATTGILTKAAVQEAGCC